MSVAAAAGGRGLKWWDIQLDVQGGHGCALLGSGVNDSAGQPELVLQCCRTGLKLGCSHDINHCFSPGADFIVPRGLQHGTCYMGSQVPEKGRVLKWPGGVLNSRAV